MTVNIHSEKELNILFVDDEEELVVINEKLLSRLGYNVKGFHSPVEALNYFESAPESIDIVVSDKYMPDLDGIELIEAIHQVRPIPSILVTGSDNGARSQKIKPHLCKVIDKPYSLAELSKEIRNIYSA